MWTILAAGDTERLQRCAAIMQQMDRAYAVHNAGAFALLIATTGLQVFYTCDAVVEAVMCYRFNPRLGRWRILTTGFLGKITPSDFCNLGMSHVGHFIRAHGLESVYTIRRFGLGNRALEAAYGYVRSHPSFSIRVEHKLHDREFWTIHLKQGM